MESLPQQLKPIGHFLKIANEHDVRDPVVAYWARFHAVQCGLNIDKSTTEAKKCLFGILDQLDSLKKSLAGNEAITNEDVAEAHIENYTIKLFKWADDQDKSSIYNKNVVKAFYSAGILFDVLTNFTKELNEELEKMRKYAKWRAAYIHNCLKNGEIPLPAESYENYEESSDGERTDNYNNEMPMPGGSNSNQFSSSGNNDMSNNSGGFNQNQNVGWQQPPADPSFSSDIPQVPHIDSFSFNQQPQQPQTFIPQQPQPNRQPESNSNNYSSTAATAVATSIPVEGISKAQKYCKFASNALNFDDVPTAIDNLEKALNLLKFGKE